VQQSSAYSASSAVLHLSAPVSLHLAALLFLHYKVPRPASPENGSLMGEISKAVEREVRKVTRSTPKTKFTLVSYIYQSGRLSLRNLAAFALKYVFSWLR
jgi:hypothetical protein